MRDVEVLSQLVDSSEIDRTPHWSLTHSPVEFSTSTEPLSFGHCWSFEKRILRLGWSGMKTEYWNMWHAVLIRKMDGIYHIINKNSQVVRKFSDLRCNTLISLLIRIFISLNIPLNRSRRTLRKSRSFRSLRCEVGRELRLWLIMCCYKSPHVRTALSGSDHIIRMKKPQGEARYLFGSIKWKHDRDCLRQDFNRPSLTSFCLNFAFHNVEAVASTLHECY